MFEVGQRVKATIQSGGVITLIGRIHRIEKKGPISMGRTHCLKLDKKWLDYEFVWVNPKELTNISSEDEEA